MNNDYKKLKSTFETLISSIEALHPQMHKLASRSSSIEWGELTDDEVEVLLELDERLEKAIVSPLSNHVRHP